MREFNKEKFIERAMELHGHKGYQYTGEFFFKKTNGDNQARRWCKFICPTHGLVEQRCDRHIGITELLACPYCCLSKGEDEIDRLLREWEVEFERQKTFSGLIGQDGGKLRYDFYLPRHDMCIEYDGVQHFEPVEHMGGDEGFIKRQDSDKRKTEYCCPENKLTLLRIGPDENIAELLLANVDIKVWNIFKL